MLCMSTSPLEEPFKRSLNCSFKGPSVALAQPGAEDGPGPDLDAELQAAATAYGFVAGRRGGGAVRLLKATKNNDSEEGLKLVQ